ncbi:MAG: glycosyltransferase family 39 protein [Acidimicrobiales bacterium]
MSEVPAVDPAAVAPRGRSWDRPRLALAAGATLVRLVAALALTRTPVGLHDPLLYQRFAQGIAKGQGYVSFDGKLTAYYPPGYPFFLGAVQWVCDHLSLTSHLPMVAAIAQSLLGGLTVWAVVGIGRRLGALPGMGALSGTGAGRGSKLGVVAGVIVAVWPNLVLHSTVLLSETLFLAAFSCFLLAMVRAIGSRRPVDLLVAGLLLGATALVRPQVLLVMGAVALAALFVRSWPARAALVGLPIVGLVVVIAPWTIRNATVFHRFVAVSTNGGDNLCVGFHPGATGHFEIPKYCDTGEFYIDGPAAEARRNTETSARARSWATGHLTSIPALSLRKLYYTYEHDHDGLRAVESYEQDRFLPAAARSVLRWESDLYYLAVMLAALGGLVIAIGRLRAVAGTRPQLVFLLGATLATALVPVIVFGETRFKVPATPCFALLAAIGVVALIDRRTGAPSPQVPASAPEEPAPEEPVG